MRTLVYTAFVLCLTVPVSGLADESAPADGPAFAREGRVSFAFNFDYGFVDMPGFNEYASQLNQQGQPKGYDDLSGVMALSR